MTPYVGMIAMFGFNRIPLGWALCNGQLLSIAEYDTLFFLIGTTYGGDGISTFGLPNLMGRLPIHMGTGNGLSPRTLGEQAGSENITLSTSNLPVHSHSIMAVTEDGDVNEPAGAYLAHTGELDKEYRTTVTPATTVQMNAASVNATGSSLPFSIIQPTLSVSICISLFGVFPSPT